MSAAKSKALFSGAMNFASPTLTDTMWTFQPVKTSSSSTTTTNLACSRRCHRIIFSPYNYRRLNSFFCTMQVADQLASANINISHFSLGRKDKGKIAMGALVLDTPIPEDILAGLGKYADLKNVVQVLR